MNKTTSEDMKLTSTGYRISKNGSILTSIEKDAIKEKSYQGSTIKQNGTYFFFNRKQGNTFIYLQ
jgi:hypothetical protein